MRRRIGNVFSFFIVFVLFIIFFVDNLNVGNIVFFVGVRFKVFKDFREFFSERDNLRLENY